MSNMVGSTLRVVGLAGALVVAGGSFDAADADGIDDPGMSLTKRILANLDNSQGDIFSRNSAGGSGHRDGYGGEWDEVINRGGDRDWDDDDWDREHDRDHPKHDGDNRDHDDDDDDDDDRGEVSPKGKDKAWWKWKEKWSKWVFWGW